MDLVFIKDLLIRGIIGINDWEREKPQDILINIWIFTDLTKAGAADNIQYSIDYRTIAKQTQALVESAKRFTVEALAADIANLCLKESGVQRVRVRVEKPHAVRFSESVGVEIERQKEE